MSEYRLKKEMGAVIQRRRNQCKFSQEHLAKLAGLSRTYLSDVERGIRNISVDALGQIARALSTTGSQLLVEAETLEHDRMEAPAAMSALLPAE